MKLTRKQDHQSEITGSTAGAGASSVIDRRTFLRRSGVTLGGIAAASALPFSMMKKASAKTAAEADPKAETKTVRTICTHCSVGCGIIAEVQKGVWTGHRPSTIRSTSVHTAPRAHRFASTGMASVASSTR